MIWPQALSAVIIKSEQEKSQNSTCRIAKPVLLLIEHTWTVPLNSTEVLGREKFAVSPSHCWNVKCCTCKLSLYRACTIITSPSSYKAVGLESELCVARLKFSSLQFSGAAVERTKPPFSRQCFPCLAEMSPSEWADTQHWEALISGWSSSLFFQTEGAQHTWQGNLSIWHTF